MRHGEALGMPGNKLWQHAFLLPRSWTYKDMMGFSHEKMQPST